MKLNETITFSRLAAIIIPFIGIVGASLTIYAFFFQEKKVDLQYEIIANSNVLDIKAELTQLDILYKRGRWFQNDLLDKKSGEYGSV